MSLCMAGTTSVNTHPEPINESIVLQGFREGYKSNLQLRPVRCEGSIKTCYWKGVAATRKNKCRGCLHVSCVQEHYPITNAVSGHSQKRPFRIVISTGDVMGDMHGAALVREIIEVSRGQGMGVEVYALGGQRMKEAGAVLIGDNTGLSSIGLLEALPLLLPSIRLQLGVHAFLKKNTPDIVVLIDYPGVNIPLGQFVKRRFGCKVVYYIPPNEWLWNTARTESIIDLSDAILSVYPGEAEYYQKAGGCVMQVGHPLTDLVAPQLTQQEAKRLLGVREEDIVVALLPASRAQELRHVWPIIASAARHLLDKVESLTLQRGKMHLIVPSILPGQSQTIEEGFQEYGLAGYAQLWHGDSHTVMAAADLAITKSGSVNLELALFNVPQVVIYKIDAATAWIAINILKFSVKHVSLVNLILDRQVVPEFIQEDADAVKVAEAAFDLLPTTDCVCRERVLEGYHDLRTLLGEPGVAKKAAQLVLSFLCVGG